VVAVEILLMLALDQHLQVVKGLLVV